MKIIPINKTAECPLLSAMQKRYAGKEKAKVYALVCRWHGLLYKMQTRD